MLGFTYKGRHSSEFGIVAKTSNRPIVPVQKAYYYETPYMDGEYDMSENNILGRTVYRSRLFEITMQIVANNIIELQHKLAKIASWLTGSGKLIFDDSNSTVWNARVSSDIGFSPESKGKSAILKVFFKVNMGQASFNTVDGISLDDAIALNSDIPFDMGVYFIKQLGYGENSIKFVNLGDFYSKPILEFSSGPKNITCGFGDKRIMVEDVDTDIIIDMDRCIVTDGEENNLLSKMQGKFFEFPSGVSLFNIYVDAECELKIRYVPKTIYDFDFSRIDWGDDSA